MPHRILSSRLAARSTTRQLEASIRADAAADRVDAAIHGVWGEILTILDSACADRPPYFAVHDVALDIFRQLQPAIESSISASLIHIAQWGHKTAADAYEATLPLGYLQVALLTPQVSHGVIDMTLREDVDTTSPAGLELGRDAAGKFAAKDLDSKEAIASILFPAPSVERIEALMNHPSRGLNWRDQLKYSSKLATPNTLATVLARGVAAGKMPREIAVELLPLVDGNRVTARRVARDECHRMANAIKEDCSKSVDSLIAGKQMHALMDIVTRPLHRARNGLIWLKNSGITKQVALRMKWDTLPDDYGCRCFESDVMVAPAWVNNQKRMDFFRERANKLSPDNAVYGDWFSKADERLQRLAVGTRRYSAVQKALDGGAMQYEHFVDANGELLSLDALRNETAEARLIRVTDLKKESAQRRQDVRDIATFGFLPPETTPPLPPIPAAPVPPPQPLAPHDLVPWNPATIAIDQKAVLDTLPTVGREVHKNFLQSTQGVQSALKAKAREVVRIDDLIRAAKAKPDTPATELLKLEDQLKGAKQRHSQAVNAKAAKQQAALKRHLSAAIADPVPIVHHIDQARTAMHPELQERMGDAVKFIAGLVARQGPQDAALELIFRQKPASDKRAKHAAGVVYLAANTDVGTILHEIGHAIEHRYPTAARAARAYLVARTGDQKLRKLSEATKDPTYADDEVGADDDFAKAFGELYAWYVGKRYANGSTELTSMALQLAYNQGAYLAKKDPGLFRFLIGILDGTLR